MSKYSILFITLLFFFNSSLLAQNHLIPKTTVGGLDKYDIALYNVFAWGYKDNVQLRMLMIPSFSKELMVGLRKSSDKYQLFSLVPDSSIWYSAWKNVPCSEPHRTVTIDRETGKRTCQVLDFTASPSERVEISTIQIDSAKAELLIDLWQEMIINSRFSKKTTITVDGVKYYFSTNFRARGILGAYTESPSNLSKPGKLVDISKYIHFAATSDSVKKQERFIDSIYIHATQLMKDILVSGGKVPERQYANRWLNGCKGVQKTLFKSDYCWQSNLDSDRFPEFIIAIKGDENYLFKMLDFIAKSEYQSIQILPVSGYNSMFSDIGTEYYFLKPQDIHDLNTSTYNTRLRLLGFKHYTINNESLLSQLNLNSNAVLISFTAIDFVHEGRNLKLKVDPAWMSLKEIMKK